MNQKEDFEVLSVGEIAKMCHVGRATVQRWINDGKIKSFTLPSGHYRVNLDSFVGFLKEYDMPIPEGLPIVKRKILIVDDDEDILEMVRQILLDVPDLNAEIRTAIGGVQACLQLGNFKPDLLILDLGMPDVNGVEVARGVSRLQEFENMEILVITGYIADDSLDVLDSMGIKNVMTKPFQFTELIAEVKKCLEV